MRSPANIEVVLEYLLGIWNIVRFWISFGECDHCLFCVDFLSSNSWFRLSSFALLSVGPTRWFLWDFCVLLWLWSEQVRCSTHKIRNPLLLLFLLWGIFSLFSVLEFSPVLLSRKMGSSQRKGSQCPGCTVLRMTRLFLGWSSEEREKRAPWILPHVMHITHRPLSQFSI